MMFMLRSTHDALMTEKEARISFLLQMHNERADAAREWRERHDALLDKLTERVTAQPAPRVKREPDEVDTAIDWKAQGDTAVRRHLERFAKAERRRGVEAKEIAQAIMDGDRRSDEDEDGIPG